MDKAIITECYVDSNLVESFVPSKTGYNKQHGCSNVAKLMKGRLSNSFALGIIDKDKKDIDYLNEFEIADEVEGYLKLWKHNDRHQYIIQIVPAVEKWVLSICNELEINIEEYDLPNSFKELCKYAKNTVSKKDVKLKSLFTDLSKKEHEAVIKLKHWVSYLKEKNYNADINDLINV